ncbi:MAG TPA: galactitol-1-phosphate 5-dehydrogenase, partial [Planctomycetaceae bacterium]|nr:galactitol-1-phosphate 5-dehydrogenase [Planctomycetaceae bacterium]
MKALVLREYRKLEVTDFPQPEVGAGEVRIAVRACGICGSDIHGYDGSTGRRIPPLVMGHEAAGVVVETGPGVDAFRVGDRVTFDSTVWCGECDYCRRGAINLCDRRQVLGVSCGDYRRHGAFAEYVVVPERIVYRLPDELPFHHAALIEAVSVAVHAVERTPVRLGDTAVLVGSGMIGLLVLQALKLAGAAKVIAIDRDETKLELARELGATDVIRASTPEEVGAAVSEVTGGRGADVAVEAVGIEPTVAAAVASVGKGG